MELYQEHGFDIQQSANSQLALVDNGTETAQRILRRLMTNPETYLFHPNYGAGLGLYVGQNLSGALERQLKGIIRTQLALEARVAQSPPPKITMEQSGTTITVTIIYTSKPSGDVYTLSFTIGA